MGNDGGHPDSIRGKNDKKSVKKDGIALFRNKRFVLDEMTL